MIDMEKETFTPLQLEGGIDWEQRRYEIAKEVYPVIVSKCTLKELPEAPITAVFLANLLVLELKKLEEIENEKKNND